MLQWNTRVTAAAMKDNEHGQLDTYNIDGTERASESMGRNGCKVPKGISYTLARMPIGRCAMSIKCRISCAFFRHVV